MRDFLFLNPVYYKSKHLRNNLDNQRTLDNLGTLTFLPLPDFLKVGKSLFLPFFIAHL